MSVMGSLSAANGATHESSAQSGDVERLLAALGPLPPPSQRPALLLVSGLPGTGKSRFCRQVQARTGAVTLESDALRLELYGEPDYSYGESRRLFSAIHAAIDRLLAEKRPVILDATNLAERHREPLYAMAERHGARLLLVQVVAPPDVVYQRLQGRGRGVDRLDRSQAGVEVYRRMAAGVEEIRRPHRVVDTSQDTEADVVAIVKEMLSP